jgi:hypothetical protein
MDVDDSAEPGMPLIKHLYSFGHMGFVPLVCTTPNGPTRPSAIAARGSFARYNPNSWFEIEGALQTFVRRLKADDQAQVRAVTSGQRTPSKCVYSERELQTLAQGLEKLRDTGVRRALPFSIIAIRTSVS